MGAIPCAGLTGIPCAAALAMGADLWSPIATSCNPTPGIGRNAPSSRDAGGGKDSIHHVSKAGRAARIGAIERKWPGFPAKPDHGHHFVITASCSVTSMRTPPLQRRRPSTPVPARRQSQRTLSEVFFNHEGCHIPQTPAETSVLRGENFTALNAPTKALKNARIGRPFRQRRTMG